MRIPFLLSSKKLTSEQEWRLLSSLYGQNLSLIEGGAALIVVEAICFYRTRSFIFGDIAAAALVILALRLLLSARYWRRATGRGATMNPHVWARRFTLGAAGPALLWGLTDLSLILGPHDETLQLFVLLVQTGWLGGVVIRNAVSPAVIYCQVVLSVLPVFIAIAVSGYSFAQVVLLFLILQISSTLRTARVLQDQMLALMESEQRLADANADLFYLSETDELTGIANRRALEARLKMLWTRSEWKGSALSLLMIDIDHFKLYNDHYGHQGGDDALKAVANCIKTSVQRPTDLPARYGGEEFAVLLPNTHEDGAEHIAKTICSAVSALGFDSPMSPLGKLTVTIGFASSYIDKIEASELVRDADRALYAAKESGRNRIRSARDTGYSDTAFSEDGADLNLPIIAAA